MLPSSKAKNILRKLQSSPHTVNKIYMIFKLKAKMILANGQQVAQLLALDKELSAGFLNSMISILQTE